MQIVPARELAELFRPQSTFGAAASMIDGALAEWHAAGAAAT